MLTISERIADPVEQQREIMLMAAINLRVAMPGIIESYNPKTQTAAIQVAIRERINIHGNEEWTEIPLLVDVPILFPRAGGYSITFPVRQGDECLVVFTDCCYDAFWQSGGIQNQVERRRHDLSDGMAIITGISQPTRLVGVSTDSLQVRNDAGTAVVEIQDTTININTGGNVNLNADGTVNISGGNINIGNNTTIAGRSFLGHTHSGVQSGSGSTGGVT